MNYEALDKALEYLNEAEIKVEVSATARKSANEAKKIIISELKKLENSKAYKDIIKALKANSFFKGDDFLFGNRHLYDDISEDTSQTWNGKPILDIFITCENLSQDLFYEHVNGVAICTLTDKLFKELKNSPKITKLPNYCDMFNGDDFWGWDIWFTVD